MGFESLDSEYLRLKFVSLFLATTLILLLLFGLVSLKATGFVIHSSYKDFAVEAEVKRNKIEIKPEILLVFEEAQKQKNTPIPEKSDTSVKRPSNTVKDSIDTNAIIQSQPPSIGGHSDNPDAKKVQNIVGAENTGKKMLPTLSGNVSKTIEAIDCMNIDKDKRPKECPPSDKAKQMVKAIQAPKYNPQAVVGFTTAETNSKKYSGWREPCENEKGGKYQVCIPLGKTPARVKTPIELCKEKGLENCKYPNLPDGSEPNSILTKGN